MHVHDHGVFLKGVSLDRTDQGRTPRFVKAEPPTDADMAAVVQTISRRVMRTLRTLGSREAGTDAAAATGDDPWGDDAPALARTLAASGAGGPSARWAADRSARRLASTAAPDGPRLAPATRPQQAATLLAGGACAADAPAASGAAGWHGSAAHCGTRPLSRHGGPFVAVGQKKGQPVG